MIKKLLSSVILLCTMCLWTPFVGAQYSADITLSTIPKFPKIGDTVTATLSSSDINLDFQDIAWYINGKKVLSGIAQYNTIFTMDPGVAKYQIRAVIGSSASQIVRETTISPGEVILLWEAVDSYVPFWYRGKALMPAEGTVRITAIPVGSNTLDKLFFVWKQGGNSLGGMSGYAKNSIVIRNNILLDSVDISVDVSSANGDYQAQGAVSISRNEPDIRLWSPRVGFSPTYEHNGVLSVFGADSTIEVLPYGLPGRANGGGILYEWLLNQIPYTHSSDEPENSVFIARSAQPITVNLSVQSLDRVLQSFDIIKRIVFE